MYSNYEVTASKITVQARNLSPTAGDDLRVSLFVATNSTEKALIDPKTVPGVRTRLIMSDLGHASLGTLKGYMTTAKAYGRNLSSMGGGTIASTTVGGQQDPSNQWFWYIQFESAKNDSTSYSNGQPQLQLYIKIKYYVRMWNTSGPFNRILAPQPAGASEVTVTPATGVA